MGPLRLIELCGGRSNADKPRKEKPLRVPVISTDDDSSLEAEEQKKIPEVKKKFIYEPVVIPRRLSLHQRYLESVAQRTRAEKHPTSTPCTITSKIAPPSPEVSPIREGNKSFFNHEQAKFDDNQECPKDQPNTTNNKSISPMETRRSKSLSAAANISVTKNVEQDVPVKERKVLTTTAVGTNTSFPQSDTVKSKKSIGPRRTTVATNTSVIRELTPNIKNRTNTSFPQSHPLKSKKSISPRRTTVATNTSVIRELTPNVKKNVSTGDFMELGTSKKEIRGRSISCGNKPQSNQVNLDCFINIKRIRESVLVKYLKNSSEESVTETCLKEDHKEGIKSYRTQIKKDKLINWNKNKKYKQKEQISLPHSDTDEEYSKKNKKVYAGEKAQKRVLHKVAARKSSIPNYFDYVTAPRDNFNIQIPRKSKAWFPQERYSGKVPEKLLFSSDEDETDEKTTSKSIKKVKIGHIFDSLASSSASTNVNETKNKTPITKGQNTIHILSNITISKPKSPERKHLRELSESLINTYPSMINAFDSRSLKKCVSKENEDYLDEDFPTIRSIRSSEQLNKIETKQALITPVEISQPSTLLTEKTTKKKQRPIKKAKKSPPPKKLTKRQEAILKKKETNDVFNQLRDEITENIVSTTNKLTENVPIINESEQKSKKHLKSIKTSVPKTKVDTNNYVESDSGVGTVHMDDAATYLESLGPSTSGTSNNKVPIKSKQLKVNNTKKDQLKNVDSVVISIRSPSLNKSRKHSHKRIEHMKPLYQQTDTIVTRSGRVATKRTYFWPTDDKRRKKNKDSQLINKSVKKLKKQIDNLAEQTTELQEFKIPETKPSRNQRQKRGVNNVSGATSTDNNEQNKITKRGKRDIQESTNDMLISSSQIVEDNIVGSPPTINKNADDSVKQDNLLSSSKDYNGQNKKVTKGKRELKEIENDVPTSNQNHIEENIVESTLKKNKKAVDSEERTKDDNQDNAMNFPSTSKVNIQIKNVRRGRSRMKETVNEVLTTNRKDVESTQKRNALSSEENKSEAKQNIVTSTSNENTDQNKNVRRGKRRLKEIINEAPESDCQDAKETILTNQQKRIKNTGGSVDNKTDVNQDNGITSTNDKRDHKKYVRKGKNGNNEILNETNMSGTLNGNENVVDYIDKNIADPSISNMTNSVSDVRIATVEQLLDKLVDSIRNDTNENFEKSNRNKSIEDVYVDATNIDINGPIEESDTNDRHLLIPADGNEVQPIPWYWRSRCPYREFDYAPGIRKVELFRYSQMVAGKFELEVGLTKEWGKSDNNCMSIISQGSCQVQFYDREKQFQANDSFLIPQGSKYKITNVGDVPLIIFYVICKMFR